MGTPVSICGEAASEPLIASLFVGLGFRQLSMSPLKTDRVKHMLRLMTTEHLQNLAYEAVLRQSGTDVWNFLKDYTSKGVLELTDT
jgi:signal transduction protein with GAF and PtsI domain